VKIRGSVALKIARALDAKVKVPGVVGLARDRAETRLLGAGLNVGKVTVEFKEGETANTVLRQIPAAGAEVDSGAKVDLVVADESKDFVKVPVILRKSLEDAKTLLAAAGLTLGTVTKGTRYFQEIVIRQTPYPNKHVRRGSAVDVVITEK
jgi:serine/threonine-protein kinase